MGALILWFKYLLALIYTHNIVSNNYLTGHCSDGVTGQPTQGLQFVLGTEEQKDIFDTIVMANLVSEWECILRSCDSAVGW